MDVPTAAPTASWLCSLTLRGGFGPCLRLCSCSEMRKDAPPRASCRWCGLWSRCWQPELTVCSSGHLQCRQASLSEPEAWAQCGHRMTIIATYLTSAGVLKAFCSWCTCLQRMIMCQTEDLNVIKCKAGGWTLESSWRYMLVSNSKRFNLKDGMQKKFQSMNFEVVYLQNGAENRTERFLSLHRFLEMLFPLPLLGWWWDRCHLRKDIFVRNLTTHSSFP